MKKVREPSPVYGGLIDKDYLRRCHDMTPAQRFDALMEMMAFLDQSMPARAKKNARILRERGF
jgi:hypothetical protein